jgi:hypothetical protein
MFDNDWKNWVLVLIAVVGVTFEVLKHLPGHESAVFDAENLHYSADSARPYSVPEARLRAARKLRAHPTHAAGDSQVLKDELSKYMAATKPTQTEFDHTADAAGKPAVKKKGKKNDDEYEEVIDPKTGKKVRRKKKKEAKKEEKKDEVAKKPELPKKPKEEIAAAVDEAIANPGGMAQAEPDRPHEGFSSLEDWIKALLTHPDLKETKFFISQFQQNLVGADIFYKITQMMLEDSRPEMKTLGVLCAGTNVNVMSFQLLAQVYKHERSGSPLHTQIDQLLNQYADPRNLPVLEKVLRGGDAYSATLAAQRLDALFTRILAQKTPPTANPSTQNTAAANASRYSRFVGVLQNLAQNHDAGLSDQARRALTDLQALLNTGTTPPAATTASTQGP